VERFLMRYLTVFQWLLALTAPVHVIVYYTFFSHQLILPPAPLRPAFDVACWGIIGLDVVTMLVLLVWGIWAGLTVAKQ
jgi:hypothetical protein